MTQPEASPGVDYLPPQPPTSGPTETSARTRPPGVLAVALLVVVVAVGVAGFFIGRGSVGTSDSTEAFTEASSLRAAYEACVSKDVDDTMTLADEGQTILIDTRSEYGDVAAAVCVMSELDTPQSITAQISRTTAMMGVQDGDHDGLHYSWSYHPDNGMNLVISQGS